jgi:hypothetical protein
MIRELESLRYDKSTVVKGTLQLCKASAAATLQYTPLGMQDCERIWLCKFRNATGEQSLTSKK